MPNNYIYHESQSFRQWWLFLILAFPHFIFVSGLYSQIVLNKQFGNNPASNGTLIAIELFLVVLTVFMLTMKLETKVDQFGIHAKFFPVFNKMRNYPWTDIKSVYVREYSPLMEYGGWGFRSSMKGNGNAWNVSGTYGLQIEMIDGKKFMIGTQKPDELKSIIENYKK